MAFTENFPDFMADFGVAATVGAVSLTGIFDSAYQDVLGLVAGSQPVLLVETALIPAAVVGTSVVIGSTTYSIAELQPDGTGLTRLVLKT